MASEKQYDFFKYVYEKEQDRYKELLNRGKLFIGVIAFYIGTLAMNSSMNLFDLIKTQDFWNNILLIGSLFFFGVGFLFNIFALGLYKHENITNLTRVIKSYGEKPMPDEQFFDYRLVDFAVATERNHKKNNLRALFLTGALICIFLGIGFHLSFVFSQ